MRTRQQVSSARRCCNSIVIAAALTAVLPRPLVADSLTGRILDPQDRVVPHAQVRLFDRASGEVRETASSPGGGYRFDHIPAGDYVLEAQGSAGSLSGATVVRVEGGSSRDLALGVSGLTAEVVVTASSTPLVAREVAKALDVIDAPRSPCATSCRWPKRSGRCRASACSRWGTGQLHDHRDARHAQLRHGRADRRPALSRRGESAERRHRLPLESGDRQHRADRGDARLGVVALRLERDGGRHQRHVAHRRRSHRGRRFARRRRARHDPLRAEPARRAGGRSPDLQRRRVVHRRDGGHSRRQPLPQRLAAGDAALPAQPHAVGDGACLVRPRRSADPE